MQQEAEATRHTEQGAFNKEMGGDVGPQNQRKIDNAEKTVGN